CQDVLAELVHTKDGSRVDRKQILKVLKPHVECMCINDDAQLVLFTALDVIDDTKLVIKTLIPEMTSPAQTLVQTAQGRRALLYLLVPRTRRHFMPAQITLLAETDNIRAKTSKKTSEVREAEAHAGASEVLIKWVKDKGALLLRETAASLVVMEIMIFAEGDKTGVIETLLRAASAAYPCAEEDTSHPINLPHAARLYKTLLQGGHFNHSSGAIEQSPAWDGAALAVKFVEEVSKQVVVAMCTKGERNSAFVVAELCEVLMGKEGEEAKEARKTLKGWFGKEVVKEIEGRETKSKVLLLRYRRNKLFSSTCGFGHASKTRMASQPNSEQHSSSSLHTLPTIPSPLAALAELITTGVQTIEAAYAKQGIPYPSLDAPFQPTPLDFDPALFQTAHLIVAAASQLIATVCSSMETIQAYTASMHVPRRSALSSTRTSPTSSKMPDPRLVALLRLV
ncbi:NUC119 domain-containing protein, partial [Mycena metata]